MWGDAVGIQQVLLNVFNNAADACTQREEQESNVTHQIHIETQCDDTNVVIKVQDNGIGLKEDSELLSKAFFTTKENGLGLGLAICRDVIETHQGQFLLEPASPQGCCVTVILPRLSRLSVDKKEIEE